jgi:leucyl-tRNA synthetase
VGERIDAFKFNTAISALMEFDKKMEGAARVDLETMALLLAPFAPHLAEACWERLGKPPFVSGQAWPSYDPKLALGDTVTVAVQVNGKLRATFEAPRGTSEEQLKSTALAQPNVQKHIEGRPPRRVIVVKGTLVNVVV